ncbi:hypothetical protein FisN_14Lh357 [Fistulifera solaris]|uniref:Zinc finger PHD-type domain-containing protein n=1 Tax=Fistulifera solaris TaxID=1519565 RepID=A0A1Z5JIF7_FISSO|nr:hypothetical protein FisN_14Lh357 [Fistulifera solaris]|eukprot:GAX13632.1 hypothetical protein FisN_14Lh357 [Fistulifera solaris]
MDRRFPFDAAGGNGNTQLTQAQLRAALGLTQVDDLSVLLQSQQRQQHDLQRDQQIRQLLLQEQLGQHVQSHQLRALADPLHDLSDLQHYQNLLLSEQLNLRREQVAQAQLRYQEELRRQQLGAVITVDDVSRSNSPNLSASSSPALLAAALRAQQQSPVPLLPSSQVTKKTSHSPSQSPPPEKQVPVAASLASADENPSRVVPKESKKRRTSSEASGSKLPKSKRPRQNSRALSPLNVALKQPPNENSSAEHKVYEDAEIVEETPMPSAGTMDMLVEAAAAVARTDQEARVLLDLKKLGAEEAFFEINVGQESATISFSIEPYESISTARFQSGLPLLPPEPVYDESYDQLPSSFVTTTSLSANTIADASRNGTKKDSNGVKASKKKILAVVTPSVPVDTWWPSVTGIRRERHAAGETSDEDNFKESEDMKTAKFRANERKIRKRLSSLAEPGCLEKLPHCKIHRIRTKEGQPEFAYCFQVTELYPNELMVCCSKCGTWRHPACGGHYENYSIRKNMKEPFIPICDFCHEEVRFLEEFPRGAERIERQRMVQLRRALATSAVMRQASFSRHGGTYKWPLGSVSVSHIDGHTRSVVARHEKAEKQWSDMVQRLGRGLGYRAKDRARSRAKELERLLVSIEDAEVYTDRHNMLHFLMRDTAREKPVGFEREVTNIFDPDNRFGAKESTPTPGRETSLCVRKGCTRHRRFDSLFCSDACGVSVIETDVMESLFEVGEIHPCFLRS